MNELNGIQQEWFASFNIDSLLKVFLQKLRYFY